MDLFNSFNSGLNTIDVSADALEIGEATPPAEKRSGVCIVLGTHPCWLNDVNKVLKDYPDADICGVNEAPRLMVCDHLATCHGEKIDLYLEHCEGYTPLVHLRDNDVKPETIDVPHHIWPVRTMAGSAPFAAAAMVMLGYDKVIFCGCPMDGGGGYAFEDTHKSTRYDPRIGFEKDHRMIKTWHRCMRLFKEQFPEMSAKICSMSGTTQQIFGGLNG